MNSLDTNILIYAADDGDPDRQSTALRIVARACREGWPVAAQVYGEFFNAATRRNRASRAEAAAQIRRWKIMMPPMVSSEDAHAASLALASQHQLPYWDALIIATCAEHGIKTLYTEDAPALKKPLGVVCKNPFAAKASIATP